LTKGINSYFLAVIDGREVQADGGHILGIPAVAPALAGMAGALAHASALRA
jgi:hypothetical protein